MSSKPPPIPEPDWASHEATLSQYAVLPSFLSQDRKAAIISELKAAFPYFVQVRQKLLDGVHKTNAKLLRQSRSGLMEECAWSSISTTCSDTGYRFVVGFRNIGCKYWQDNPFSIGCYCCGYCASVVPGIEPSLDELERQFEKAMSSALAKNVEFDVVEFLSDGSFLNPEECPPEFRLHLFRKLATLKYIRRILIESRPEYVTADSIRDLLKELPAGVTLEIGMGLESADEFIRSACLNKGFAKKDFEAAVSSLAAFGERVRGVVYMIVKPPFLTEREAIEDIMNTVGYLAELADRKGIQLIPKLEPAAVARGTMLETLYFGQNGDNRRRYTMLSYWTVIEIIARLYEAGFAGEVRVGAREDMDVIEKIPAVYDPNGLFNKYDFVLYEAIQWYNEHQSLTYVLADVADAMKQRGFERWRAALGLEETAIERCSSALADEIKKQEESVEHKQRKIFLAQIFNVLSHIEYDQESQKFAKAIVKRIDWRDKKAFRAEVDEFVDTRFREILQDVGVEVIDFNLERDHPKLLRLYIGIRHLNTKTESYDVWVGIPTVSVPGSGGRNGGIQVH